MVGAWAAAWGRVAAGRALPDVVNAEAPEARRAAAVYFILLCVLGITVGGGLGA